VILLFLAEMKLDPGDNADRRPCLDAGAYGPRRWFLGRGRRDGYGCEKHEHAGTLTRPRQDGK